MRPEAIGLKTAKMSPMIQLRVDEMDVPPGERTFWNQLAYRLGPEYEVLITVQESEWLPRGAIEHLHVFIHSHRGSIGAVLGYVVKTAVDVFKGWAIERLKRAPGNTEVVCS
jgi:hypothetical protein